MVPGTGLARLEIPVRPKSAKKPKHAVLIWECILTGLSGLPVVHLAAVAFNLAQKLTLVERTILFKKDLVISIWVDMGPGQNGRLVESRVEGLRLPDHVDTRVLVRLTTKPATAIPIHVLTTELGLIGEPVQHLAELVSQIMIKLEFIIQNINPCKLNFSI